MIRTFTPGARTFRSFLIFTISLIPTLASGGQSLETQTESVLSTVDSIREDFKDTPCRQSEPAAGVRALFAKMGASIDDPAVRQFDGVADIIVRTGSSDEIIVIGAHYDFVDRGCGAIDNWSGIVTLAHLYRSIRMLSAHKTVLFVAFGKEEEGLLGSKAMAAAIPPDQLSNYCAMINVDSVGLAKLFALENASSSSLVELAKKTAARMNIPFYTTRVKGDSDSSSFAAPCHHIVRAVERLDVDFTYPQRSGFQSGSGGRLFRFQIGSRHVAGPRWTTVHRVPQCWEEAVASAVEAPSLIVGDRKRGAAT